MASTPRRCRDPSTTRGSSSGRQHPAAWRALRGVDIGGELGRDDDLVAERRERLSDELFVGVRPVDLGGVEESHTALDGAVQQGHHLLPVRVPL